MKHHDTDNCFTRLRNKQRSYVGKILVLANLVVLLIADCLVSAEPSQVDVGFMSI
jgi:hypothetical protein